MTTQEKGSDLAGKWVRIHDHVRHPQYKDFGGSWIRIEGRWDDITGRSWMVSDGNPACMIYAIRTGFSDPPVPTDNEVFYGHRQDGLGSLVHLTEIDTENAQNTHPTEEAS